MNFTDTAFTAPLTLHRFRSCNAPSTCHSRRPREANFPASSRTLCTCVSTPVSKAPSAAWQKRLKLNAVVEYFANKTLHLGLIAAIGEKGLEVNNPETGKTVKITLGEIVSVWSTQMTEDELVEAKIEAEELLSTKNVDISALYNERARGKRPIFNATAAGRTLFPDAPSNDVATIAAGCVLAAHTARFRRAEAGQGWRVNPPAVAATREAEAFVKGAKSKLDGASIEEAGLNRTEARAFLNALEVCAASATKPNKPLARVMKELGYEDSSTDAGNLLRALGVWEESNADAPRGMFAADVLEAARKVRVESMEKRWKWMAGEMGDSSPRRSLLNMAARVYCIDNRTTNFLDDSISIEPRDDGQIARISVHIADVAGVVERDTLLDQVARERAQSMYLPLRPLHMLPPPAMDSASFSENFPTESITVQIDYSVGDKRVVGTDIFLSVVPPVLRVSFDQFDKLLKSDRESLLNELSAERCADLRMLAMLAPQVAMAMKRPTAARRDETQVSDVRLVARTHRGRTYRQARVSRYRNSGAHAVLGELLGVAGGVFRKYAHKAKVALPEEPGAERYARRCATAPMRRYLDLASQRQIRTSLMGLPVATTDEMTQLRLWLTKRRTETQKTVAQKRMAALFENFAETVAQQKAVTGREYALVKGTVTTANVSKRGTHRVGVHIEGVGIDVPSGVDGKFEDVIAARVVEEGAISEKGAKPVSKIALAQIALRNLFPLGSEVKLRVREVNPAARKVDAVVVDRIGSDKEM